MADLSYQSCKKNRYILLTKMKGWKTPWIAIAGVQSLGRL
jgi:hypothetical protein